MPVSARTKLGSYLIISPLGKGGMGEVYRATDTKLGREVALKVLPETFARDADRMARFRREAQVLASLNHPNIAAIYGLEDADGVRALVMELVEGPTLAERIAAGVVPAQGSLQREPQSKPAIPLEESLHVAKQIADGLEYAHERGIVHRDLKPANVKVRPDETVKILDFGLAKALEESPASGTINTSPTLTAAATREGIILGTAAYMAPEQARGKPVDKRADVWAFGVVLYEMLTGRQAFGGETVSDTLAAVITKEPDWEALPPSTPPRIGQLLRRCLTKDPKQRLQAIGEARIAIEQAMSGVDAVPQPTPAFAGVRASRAAAWTLAVPWGVAAVLALALAAVMILIPARLRRPPGPVMHLNLAAQAWHAEADRASGVAISQDGTRVAYVAVAGTPETEENGELVSPQAQTFGLVVRKLDQLAPTPLPETAGGAAPFFSPDGRWIGFFSGGALKKVSSDGGPPVTLCQVPHILGASWGDDGFIYFAPTAAEILRVPEQGGTPKVVVQGASGEAAASFRWPQILPGGKTVLFTTAGASWLAKHYRTEAYSLSTGKRTVLMEEGANARYLTPGYLVFTRGNVLMGAPFDADGLKITGPAEPLIEGVTWDEWFGSADYALSSTGTLIYLTGGVQTAYRLVSVDMAGKVEPVGTQERGFEDLSVSPDGKRIVATLVENGSADLWTYDRERDALTRLTQAGDCGDPLWSPDGSRVFYTNPASLYAVPADGSSPPQSFNSEQWAEADSFLPGGEELLYSTLSPETNDAALWLQSIKTGAQRKQLFPGVARVFDARFSPDGRWIAYVSAQSGRAQVYLQAYPGPGERVQVSTDGGLEPVWAPNGSELYFRNAMKFMAVDVKLRPALAAGKPRLLFEGDFELSHHDYGLMPDGRHFIMIQPVGKSRRRSCTWW